MPIFLPYFPHQISLYSVPIGTHIYLNVFSQFKYLPSYRIISVFLCNPQEPPYSVSEGCSQLISSVFFFSAYFSNSWDFFF